MFSICPLNTSLIGSSILYKENLMLEEPPFIVSMQSFSRMDEFIFFNQQTQVG
jgi:hypothetical protein